MHALIFGRARHVWDEITYARSLGEFGCIIAVGRAGADYPGFIDHWVSFHAELFEKWTETRRARHFPLSPIMYWTAIASGRVRAAYCNGLRVNEIKCEGGSSGLIAVKVARQLGCDRIVLAGIPMTAEAGHYDDHDLWAEAEVHRKVWEQQLDELRPLVRSCSGWTQERFGQPTQQWLATTE
jgi:hypothetical protein